MNKIFLLAILSMFSCALHAQSAKGSGTLIKQERNLSSFTKIDVGGAFEVFIKQGATQSVVVETDDNLVEFVKTNVVNKELKIFTVRKIQKFTKMSVYITMAELTELDVSGASSIVIDGTLQTEELEIELSGASKFYAKDINAGNLKMDFNGASEAKIDMSTTKVSKVEMSGASKVNIGNLKADIVKFNISGASNSDIGIDTKEVYVIISGASKLQLNGYAGIQKYELSGASALKADKLAGEQVDVNTSGASSVTIAATIAKSDVKSTGASSVNKK